MCLLSFLSTDPFVVALGPMSTRSGDRQREAVPRLKPSFIEDNGWYVTVVCGGITGQLYVNTIFIVGRLISWPH